jgi:outer membrane lipopolysaccharide assembly protein LptE/RlpB
LYKKYYKAQETGLAIKKTTIIDILILVVLCSGCGYTFTGGGNFPSGIKSICVNTLKNRSSETSIENTITNDIIYEITRSGRIQLTGIETAEAVLDGEVESLRVYSVSRRGSHASIERRVEVSVALTLTDKNNKIIWSVKGFSDDETFEVTSDKLSTEQKKRDAVSTLSKRLAENIFNRMTDNF